MRRCSTVTGSTIDCLVRVGDWFGTCGEPRMSRLGAPLARACAAPDASKLDWRLVSRVLAADPRPDTLVVGGGVRRERRPPTNLDELAALFRDGLGLALRHTQRCAPELAAIHADFERALGPAQVQMFVTPMSTHGFGWHYDDEEVFIAQTVGVKDYYFRANTVTTNRAHGCEFQRYADEVSPLHTATLVAGDLLYIPARWWHVALCRENAISVSVGVTPRQRR